MGEIQSNINSILSNAGIMIGLGVNSPAGKSLIESGRLKRQQRALKIKENTTANAIKEKAAQGQQLTDADATILRDVMQQRRDNFKAQFDANPTAKNYDSYSRYLNIQTPQERAAQRAKQHMEEAQSEKRARISIYGSSGEVK